MPEPLSPNSGFGMNVTDSAVLPRGVLDDALEQLDVIGRVQQRVELVVDLGLTGGADLVVAALKG